MKEPSPTRYSERGWSVSSAAAGRGEQRRVVKSEAALVASFHRRTGAPFFSYGTYLDPRRAMRCGQDGMDARRTVQAGLPPE